MREEYETPVVLCARGSHHRRYDFNDDGQTRNEYRQTEGTSRFQRCVDVQGKLTRRDLRLDQTNPALLTLLLSFSLGEKSARALHAQDDRDLRFTTEKAHRPVSP